MRRTPLALSSLALVAALALAGCSGDKGSDANASASATVATNVSCADLTIDKDSDSLPKVSGDAGTLPTLAWAADAKAPTNLTVKTLSKGDGAEVAENAVLNTSYAGWQWGKDETFDSSFSRGATTSFALSQVVTGWRCGLVGTHVGDRVEMSVPSSLGYGDDASSGSPTGTLVFVVDVVDAVNPDEAAAASKDATLEGEQQLADRGLSITGDLGAEPAITVNEGAAEPTAVEMIVLARGTGSPVAGDSKLVVEYALMPWGNGQQVSSWQDKMPQPLTVGQSQNFAGMIGLPVGSRVVILLPADETTGNPSTAYVVDIAKAF